MSIDKIIKAAEISGFNLEFKTKKILDELNFYCNLNSLYRLNDEIIEIDLLAKDHKDKHLVIECKGCSADSFLILIQEQEHMLQDQNNVPYQTTILLLPPALFLWQYLHNYK